MTVDYENGSTQRTERTSPSAGASCSMTLLQHLDRFPPFLCFALARDNHHRPLLEVITKQAGLNKRTFQRIAKRISWKGVKVCQVDLFCSACGVNIWNMKNHRDYISKTMQCRRPFTHLMPQQLKQFQVQCARWKAAKQ
jgi:hypothetical protein